MTSLVGDNGGFSGSVSFEIPPMEQELQPSSLLPSTVLHRTILLSALFPMLPSSVILSPMSLSSTMFLIFVSSLSNTIFSPMPSVVSSVSVLSPVSFNISSPNESLLIEDKSMVSSFSSKITSNSLSIGIMSIFFSFLLFSSLRTDGRGKWSESFQKTTTNSENLALIFK